MLRRSKRQREFDLEGCLMAKQADSVVDFDVSKYFGDLNKYVADFKAPALDYEGFAATQRKNFDAIVAANKLAAEAMQAVARRQVELLRQGMDEIGTVARSYGAPGALPEKAAKQAELTKAAFERGVSNARELSEMVTKSNFEAIDLLNKRFAQSLDELRDAWIKMK